MRGVGTPDGLEIWLDVNPLRYNRTGAPENADQHAASSRRRALRRSHYYGNLDSTSCMEACDELVKSVLPRLPLDGTAREVPRVTSGTPTFEGALRYDWAGAPPDLTRHRRLHRRAHAQPGLGGRWPPPAALVLCRARPAADVVTLDVGSKSVAAEVGDRASRRRPPRCAQTRHLPVRLPPGASPIERNTPLPSPGARVPDESSPRPP